MSSRFIRSDGTGLGVKMAPGAKVSRTSASPSKLGASDGLDVSGRTAPMAQPALMREDRMRAKAEASANSKTHIQGEENGAGECLRMPGAEHSKQFEAQQDWGVGSKPNNKVRGDLPSHLLYKSAPLRERRCNIPMHPHLFVEGRARTRQTMAHVTFVPRSSRHAQRERALGRPRVLGWRGQKVGRC